MSFKYIRIDRFERDILVYKISDDIILFANKPNELNWTEKSYFAIYAIIYYTIIREKLTNKYLRMNGGDSAAKDSPAFAVARQTLLSLRHLAYSNRGWCITLGPSFPHHVFILLYIRFAYRIPLTHVH